MTSVDKRSQSDAAKARLSLAHSDQLTLYNAFIGSVLVFSTMLLLVR